MKIDKIIYLIDIIQEKTNEFILKELNQVGFNDITPSHADVLAILFQHGECTIADIVNNTHKNSSLVTTLVKNLIKLGYISSKKDNNKLTTIFLTEKGTELEPKFREISQKLYDIEYKGISENEKEIFEKELNRIYNKYLDIKSL